jgi:hypothetical protein
VSIIQHPVPQLTTNVLMPARFTKACRHKGRWINVAICFGIDLQDIFRLGIRFDRGNFAAYNDGDNNDDDDDDDDSICDMCVFFVTLRPC